MLVLIKKPCQPVALPVMMGIAMSMMIVGTMPVVVMEIVPFMFAMAKHGLPSVSILLPVHFLGGPGNEPFELPSVEPDATAFLADIYGDPIPFLLLENWFIAARTDHIHSFHNILRALRGMPGARG